MTWLAFKLLLGGWFKAIGAFFSSCFKWFMGLSPVLKVASFLALSVMANLYQCSHSSKVKTAVKDATITAQAVCAKNNQIADDKAVVIHNDRQSIWDLFVENAKKGNQKALIQGKTTFEKEKVKHESLVKQNPLSVDCKLADPVVRQANQAIADAATRPL